MKITNAHNLSAAISRTCLVIAITLFPFASASKSDPSHFESRSDERELNTFKPIMPAALTTTWVARSSMLTPRYGHTVATGPNGRIYAVAGVTGAVVATNEEYDPLTNSWRSRTPMTVARASPGAAAATNGRIYVVGGYTGSRVATNEEYDPVANTWLTRTAMTYARDGLAVVGATNGKVYAIGGSLGTGAAPNVEEYDPVTNLWTSRASMLTPRFFLSAVEGADGKIYAIGGVGVGGYGSLTGTVEAYDPVANQWTKRANMPTPRFAAGAALAPDGRIYVIGGAIGQFNGSDTRIVEAYDPATDSWLTMPSLQIARRFVGGAVGGNGKLYAIGGSLYGNPTPFGTVEELDTSAAAIQLTHIEVIQATQTVTNSVPLVANKPTLVRVYAASNQRASATATLVVAPSAGTRVAYTRTIGQLPAPTGWPNLRSDKNATFNFILPSGFPSGTASFTATVRTSAGETATLTLPSFPVQAGKKLRIAWVGMPYLPPQPAPAPGQPPPQPTLPDVGIALSGTVDLVDMFPLSPSDVDYFLQPGFEQVATEPFRCVENGPCPLSSIYLSALNTFWKRTTNWAGGVTPDRLYGWVPSAAFPDVCGVADATWSTPLAGYGRVAAGVDDPCGAETLAHEIGHLLNAAGLRHTANEDRPDHCRGIPLDPGPYPEFVNLPRGSIGEWGTRVRGDGFDLFDPEVTWDFMSYCEPEWVSAYNYLRLMEGFVAPTQSLQLPDSSDAAQLQAIVSGIVFSPALTATLNSLFVITSTLPPDPDLGGPYCVELRDVSNGLLNKRCFAMPFMNPATGGPTLEQGFVLGVPFPATTRAVVLTRGAVELTRLGASPSSPTVTITSPATATIWATGSVHTVTWSAGDLDGETLHFAVSLSTNGGSTWNPLVLDTADSYVVLSADRLPGANGALLRVEVSDGFNTSSDTTPVAFSIALKPPVPLVTAPKGGDFYAASGSVMLSANAYDFEDGPIPASALVWTSSRDGVLGTGRLLAPVLSNGAHTITLTVTDSDLMTSTAAMSVYVGNRVFVPFATR